MAAGIDLVLYVIAAVLFGLGGFNVPAAVKWESLAFMALTLSLIV
jgi:hypothetical protein